MTIAVCIPAHPARLRPLAVGGLSMLDRAIASVIRQTRQPDQIVVAVDHAREGSWRMRNSLLGMVRADWVAWLDSDDFLKPEHLELLGGCAAETGADYVFSWFDDRYTGGDPLGHFGKPFDPGAPHHTTSTILVRTELARRVGFTGPEPGDVNTGEDWRFTLACVAAGARIVHLPKRTWFWVWHADPRDPMQRRTGPNGHALGNTSGRPDAGDARGDDAFDPAGYPSGNGSSS